MRIKFLILLSFLSASVNAEKLIRVTHDDTTICYPEKYSPDTSFMDAMLAPIKDELDDSSGQQLVYIPASEIKKKIPEYSLSHANKYNPKVAHDINGITYSLSNTHTEMLSDEAWNIHQKLDKPVIYKDEKTGFYKVFTFAKEIGPWHLVKTPPVKNDNNSKEKDWYIGFCGEMVDSYNCKINAIYKSVVYEYSLNEQNITMHKQVQSVILDQIASWEKSCPES
jgi:hypothetical protein